jgi:putative tryptophan/tyrosine transport system substrate-binding protein
MSDIRRREFITLLGGAAAAWPLAARAQQARIPRVGIIDNSSQWDPFRRGLRDHGYVEGRTIALEYRIAEGAPARLAAAATELAQLPVDVIAAYGTPPTRAAKQATERIPIVMIGIGDPVGAALVASLARPGGNITGNTVLSPDLGAKRSSRKLSVYRAWRFCSIRTTPPMRVISLRGTTCRRCSRSARTYWPAV